MILLCLKSCKLLIDDYKLDGFDNFICRIENTYASETILNKAGKIDYHVFKPVLFEFPTYEYFVTGEKVGDCARMDRNGQ